MYKSKRMRFENCIEVFDYHDLKYGAPGRKRRKKTNPTKEQVAMRNQRVRERKARWKLRKYFQKYDYFVTLTYRREERPSDMKECQKHTRTFLQKMKRRYERLGEPFRYLMNIEVGTKNGWHVHICLKRVPDLDIMLADSWIHGRVHIKLMYEKGGFRELAAYITKTPRTDKKLREAKFSCSKNMPLPDPEVKLYKRWKTFTKIRVPKGWELEKDSYFEGENELTGQPYRSYTLIKIQKQRR